MWCFTRSVSVSWITAHFPDNSATQTDAVLWSGTSVIRLLPCHDHSSSEHILKKKLWWWYGTVMLSHCTGRRYQGGLKKTCSFRVRQDLEDLDHTLTPSHTNTQTETQRQSPLVCTSPIWIQTWVLTSIPKHRTNFVYLWQKETSEVKSFTHFYGHILSVEECLRSEKTEPRLSREYNKPDCTDCLVSVTGMQGLVTSDLQSFVWRNTAGFQKSNMYSLHLHCDIKYNKSNHQMFIFGWMYSIIYNM